MVDMANGLENKAFDFMREGATKSFEGFIEKATEKSPHLTTPPSEGGGFGSPKAYEKIWEEGNKPFIKMYDRGELSKEGQHRYGGSAHSTDRAFFTHAENYPEEPDTIHIGQRLVTNFMAEMGHAIDYNTSRDERKELRNRGNFERALWGEGVYGKDIEEGDPSGKDPGLYYPKGPKKRSILSFIGHTLWPGTEYKKYEEGITQQSEVPTEFHAHRVTEERLWENLKEGKYE